MKILYFGAGFCGPCKQQKPIIDEIESEMDVDVERYDVDEATGVANEYNVRSVPTVVVEHNEQDYTVFSGLTQKSEIVGAIEE